MQKIIWLLFHEPVELFIRTAQHFEKELNQLSGDQWNFEILELAEYEKRYNSGAPCDPIVEMLEGRVQMSQLYSQVFPAYNASDFMALELPFIFRDHDHATRVFESSIADELMQHLEDRVKIKGLGFTYSGGYRCWKCDQPIESLDDLKQLSISPRQHPVATQIWKTLGVNIKDQVLPGERYNICNSTLPRFHADGQDHQHYAIETGHAMYLTNIFMNLDLWTSLDETSQQHFKQAATICARQERKQSVADAEELKTNRELALQRGIHEVQPLAPTVHQQLVERLSEVTHEWKQYLTPGLVDRIIAA